MYHSINVDISSGETFSSNSNDIINTYSDLYLVPDGRPTISNPKLNSTYVDIPGASGSLDASEWLTGFPTYKDREGDIQFYVLNDHGIWTDRRNRINALFHGRTIKLQLEDEPGYFYKGRMAVDDWSSEKDGGYSKITLKYRLEPYKYSLLMSADNWKWDPFNFETGIIYDRMYSNITLSSDGSKGRVFSGIMLPYQPSYGYFGVAANSGDLTVRFINPELNIDDTATLKSGKSVYKYSWLFSNLSGKNKVTVKPISGTGKLFIQVRFRCI